MSDFNVVGKIEFDAGKAKKELSDLSQILEEQKKIWKGAEIGSKEYQDAQQKIKETTEKYNKIAEEQNAIAKKQAGSFGTLKQGLNGLAPGLQGATTGVMALGKQMWLLVANPIGAIVAAIVGVFALLYNVLKGFDPVMDAIEQGFAAVSAVFNTLLDGVLQLVTGAKSLGDVFGNLGGDIKEAAKQAVEFTKAQQDLDDLLAKSTVNQSKYNRQINELILQSKDRTKTEAERIALIDGALNIEEKAFSERKKIADQELLIAQNAIISGKNLSVSQRKQLKEKGVDYAISLKDVKKVTDEEVNNLAAALAKKEDIENQSITLREKALNRKYVLEDAAIAKQEALEVKQASARQKRAEEKAKADQKLADDEKIRFDARQKELDAFTAKVELDAYIKKEDDRKAKIAKEDALHVSTLASMKARLAIDVKANADAIDAQIAADNLLLETKKQNQSAAIGVANAAIELLGRQSKAGKALAAGLATIDTLQAIVATLKGAAKGPGGGIPGYAIAQAISTGIFGFLNVKKILSTNLPGGGGGGGGSAPSIPNAPAPVLPQQSSTSLNASSIQSVGNASQGGVNRSFVLDADISNNQERQARLARAARLS